MRTLRFGIGFCLLLTVAALETLNSTREADAKRAASKNHRVADVVLDDNNARVVSYPRAQ